MKQAIFVSPHFDDAVFSAGAMMLTLLHLGFEVGVLTVCSEVEKGKETLSAKAYLRQVGEQSAQDLYAKRKSEDAESLQAMKVRSVNLGHVEALWRKRTNLSSVLSVLASIFPEIAHVYPTYKFHITSGKISAGDSELLESLVLEIQSYLTTDTLLFAPLGIGGHIDHIVTRVACELTGHPVIYWADIPYVIRPGARVSDVETDELEKYEIANKKLLTEKDVFCKLYATQYKPVFGNLQPSEIHEVFYYPKGLTKFI